jgi:hypothetical protein
VQIIDFSKKSEVKRTAMANSQDENESLDRRFGELLDEALRNPPEESTTREELIAAREKLALCLEKGLSRRFLHAQFMRAGGVVSYQRFCVLLKEVMKDMAFVRTIREKEAASESGGRKAKNGGSRLLNARRKIGKTLSEIRGETTAALAEIANLGGND